MSVGQTSNSQSAPSVWDSAEVLKTVGIFLTAATVYLNGRTTNPPAPPATPQATVEERLDAIDAKLTKLLKKPKPAPAPEAE